MTQKDAAEISDQMLAFNANQLVGGEEEDKDNDAKNEAAAN